MQDGARHIVHNDVTQRVDFNGIHLSRRHIHTATRNRHLTSSVVEYSAKIRALVPADFIGSLLPYLHTVRY